VATGFTKDDPTASIARHSRQNICVCDASARHSRFIILTTLMLLVVGVSWKASSSSLCLRLQKALSECFGIRVAAVAHYTTTVVRSATLVEQRNILYST
jgi:hypothetical protein